jgi:hypothetical protein
VERLSDPVPREVWNNLKTVLCRRFAHGGSNVSNASSGPALADAGHTRVPPSLSQPQRFVGRTHRPDRKGPRNVPAPAVYPSGEIEGDNVSMLHDCVIRETVGGYVVSGGAKDSRKGGQLRQRLGPQTTQAVLNCGHCITGAAARVQVARSFKDDAHEPLAHMAESCNLRFRF